MPTFPLPAAYVQTGPGPGQIPVRDASGQIPGVSVVFSRNLTDEVAEVIREQVPSGFVRGGKLLGTNDVAPIVPNRIYFDGRDEEPEIVVDGFRLTLGRNLIPIDLQAAPTAGERDDLVFIEVWFEKQGEARVPLWRLRTIAGVDMVNHPDGVSDPIIKAWGPLGRDSSVSFVQVNPLVYPILRDPGLYSAGILAQQHDPTTVAGADGKFYRIVYAIPVARVKRMNRATYNANTNPNGAEAFDAGTPNTLTTRPDGLWHNVLTIANHVCDLRHHVTFTSDQQRTFHAALSRYLNNAMGSQGLARTLSFVLDNRGQRGHFADTSVTQHLSVSSNLATSSHFPKGASNGAAAEWTEYMGSAAVSGSLLAQDPGQNITRLGFEPNTPYGIKRVLTGFKAKNFSLQLGYRIDPGMAPEQATKLRIEIVSNSNGATVGSVDSEYLRLLPQDQDLTLTALFTSTLFETGVTVQISLVGGQGAVNLKYFDMKADRRLGPVLTVTDGKTITIPRGPALAAVGATFSTKNLLVLDGVTGEALTWQASLDDVGNLVVAMPALPTNRDQKVRVTVNYPAGGGYNQLVRAPLKAWDGSGYVGLVNKHHVFDRANELAINARYVVVGGVSEEVRSYTHNQSRTIGSTVMINMVGNGTGTYTLDPTKYGRKLLMPLDVFVSGVAMRVGSVTRDSSGVSFTLADSQTIPINQQFQLHAVTDAPVAIWDNMTNGVVEVNRAIVLSAVVDAPTRQVLLNVPGLFLGHVTSGACSSVFKNGASVEATAFTTITGAGKPQAIVNFVNLLSAGDVIEVVALVQTELDSSTSLSLAYTAPVRPAIGLNPNDELLVLTEPEIVVHTKGTGGQYKQNDGAMTPFVRDPLLDGTPLALVGTAAVKPEMFGVAVVSNSFAGPPIHTGRRITLAGFSADDFLAEGLPLDKPKPHRTVLSMLVEHKGRALLLVVEETRSDTRTMVTNRAQVLVLEPDGRPVNLLIEAVNPKVKVVEWSEPVPAAPSLPTPPSAPIVRLDLGQRVLSWSTVDGADSYEVLVGSDRDNITTPLYAVQGTFQALAELDEGWFAVRGSNAGGPGDLSNAFQVDALDVPPIPVLTSYDETTRVLNWQATLRTTSYIVSLDGVPQQTNIQTTTFTIAGDWNGVVTVDAANSIGDSQQRRTLQSPGPQQRVTPDAPVGVPTVSLIVDNTDPAAPIRTLKWAGVAKATKYNIYLDGTSYAPTPTVNDPNNLSSARRLVLRAQDSGTFVVKAANAYGESTSATTSANTMVVAKDVLPPQDVLTLEVNTADDKRQLLWYNEGTDTTDPRATSYEIDTDGDTFTETSGLWDIPSNYAGAFRVRGVNQYGKGAYSNILTVPARKPDLRYDPFTRRLSWDPVIGATGYNLFRNGTYELTAQNESPTSRRSFYQLIDDQYGPYALIILSGDSGSETSNTVFVPPAQVTSVTYDAQQGQLLWSPVPGAVGYRVYFTPFSGGQRTHTDLGNVTNLKFDWSSPTDILRGLAGTYQVAGYSLDGETKTPGVPSPSVVVLVPGAPSSLAVSGSGVIRTLSWVNPSAQVGVPVGRPHVFQDGVDITPSGLPSTATTYNISNDVSGVFTIRSVNGLGMSQPSNTLNVVGVPVLNNVQIATHAGTFNLEVQVDKPASGIIINRVEIVDGSGSVVIANPPTYADTDPNKAQWTYFWVFPTVPLAAGNYQIKFAATNALGNPVTQYSTAFSWVPITKAPHYLPKWNLTQQQKDQVFGAGQTFGGRLTQGGANAILLGAITGATINYSANGGPAQIKIATDANGVTTVQWANGPTVNWPTSVGAGGNLVTLAPSDANAGFGSLTIVALVTAASLALPANSTITADVSLAAVSSPAEQGGSYGGNWDKSVPFAAPLGAPTNVVIDGTGLMSWTAVANAGAYEVLDNTGALISASVNTFFSNGFWGTGQAVGLGANATSFQVPGAGTYFVRAVSASSMRGLNSVQFEFKLPAPTNVKYDGVKITWNAVTGATKYSVYNVTAGAKAGETTNLYFNVANGTFAYFEIAAVDATGKEGARARIYCGYVSGRGGGGGGVGG